MHRRAAASLAATLLLLATAVAGAQPQPMRVLLVTHSADFHHESTNAARESLQSLDRQRFDITATTDLSYIRASRLSEFHAVFFFTSGELIGGYFDGHPWVGQTDIEIEDPRSSRHAKLCSRYFVPHSRRDLQVRNFSRERGACS